MTDERAGAADPRLGYDEALALVRDRVDDALSGAPPIIGQYVGALRGAWGKFIRARFLLACALDGEDRLAPAAVLFAAAIELTHLATLVHDDVIDDADVRRGAPTLQKRYGKRTAVICGDYLLSAALKTATGAPNRQDYWDMDLPGTLARVCAGELNQHINSGNLGLTVFEYLRIISGKTAALFEASCYAGALLSGCDRNEYPLYRRLGWQAGMVFQMADDCLDYEATAAQAKKPVRSDFEQNVITLPLICALRRSARFLQKVQGGGVTRAQVQQGVVRYGGLEETRALAGRYSEKCEGIVARLAMTPYKRDQLRALLAGINRPAPPAQEEP